MGSALLRARQTGCDRREGRRPGGPGAAGRYSDFIHAKKLAMLEAIARPPSIRIHTAG
jgi:hypothetical protein